MRYQPTGRALVYAHGHHEPIECNLEDAQLLYVGQPGYEVYRVLGEADGE